jgi:hypothetical protein
MSRRSLWAGGIVVLSILVLAAVILVRRGERTRVAPNRAASYQAFIRQSLFALLKPVALSNCRLERFGEPHDGGYLVCANLLDAVEAGYSYGISGYDQFGCDLSRRLNVRVHEYDCFDTRQPACPGGDLLFHAECVGPPQIDAQGRPFDSMAHQIDRTGNRTKRLLIKIDVEGAEWNEFLLTPDRVFEQTDQLVVEFHGVNEDRFLSAVRRLTTFFHVVHVHFNNFSCDRTLTPFPAGAYEVLFVNRRIGVVDTASAKRSSPDSLDAPNNPAGPDCQIAGAR